MCRVDSLKQLVGPPVVVTDVPPPRKGGKSSWSSSAEQGQIGTQGLCSGLDEKGGKQAGWDILVHFGLRCSEMGALELPPWHCKAECFKAVSALWDLHPFSFFLVLFALPLSQLLAWFSRYFSPWDTKAVLPGWQLSHVSEMGTNEAQFWLPRYRWEAGTTPANAKPKLWNGEGECPRLAKCQEGWPQTELSCCPSWADGAWQLGLAVVLWGADPGRTPRQKEQSSMEGVETKSGAVKAKRWSTKAQS